MITVSLNRKELKAHGACADGLACFRKFLKTGGLKPSQTLSVEWTPLAYCMLADLPGADLRYADLQGADLGNYECGPDGFARRKVGQ